MDEEQKIGEQPLQTSESTGMEQVPSTSTLFSRNKFIVGVIVTFAVIIAALGSAYIYFQSKNTNVTDMSAKDSGVESDTENILNTPIGLTNYKNDLLGLSFNYPDSWGNVKTHPVENLTNLKPIWETGLTNSVYDSIRLYFDDRKAKIKIYGEQLGGEKYSGIPYGPIDNVSTLSESADACKYHIDYRSSYKGSTLKETYSNCRDGVKVAVIEHAEMFGPPTGTLYTYDLNYYGYKHLQNGLFDDLLLSYNAAHALQSKGQLTAADFLNQAGVNIDSPPLLTEFTTTVHSIRTYPPPIPQKLPLKVPEGEDENVTLIKHYYNLLENSRPDQAYGLLYGPTVTVSDFVTDHSDIYKSSPRDFRKLTENTYELWLDYQEHNSNPQKQRAEVKIIDGKIKFTLFETLTSPIATFGDWSAYGANRDDKNIVVLRLNDEEIIVDSAPSDVDRIGALRFYEVNFSPQGNYIMYTGVGYEWANAFVYDIRNDKIVWGKGSRLGEFNPEETVYFYCESNDFLGEYAAKVYTVPEFSLKLNLLEQSSNFKYYWGINCSADKEKKIIQFDISGTVDENPEAIHETYEVDLNTGDLINSSL